MKNFIEELPFSDEVQGPWKKKPFSYSTSIENHIIQEIQQYKQGYLIKRKLTTKFSL